VRLYGCLINDDHLEAEDEEDEVNDDFISRLNPNSLVILSGCLVEPGLAGAEPGVGYQFLRQGYFCRDIGGRPGEKLVFNRIVPLRDSWAKIEKGITGSNQENGEGSARLGPR